jgi:uncharacterized damage-inducible protein DinB
MERTDPVLAGDQLTMLTQFLDYHRDTLVWKASGLTREQLGTRTAASELTLAGLLKHMAYVEDSWFTRVLLGKPIPEPWASAPFAEDRDWELHSAPDDEPEALVDLYRQACARSRAAVAEVGDLDALAQRPGRDGEQFSLHWILLHMLEETARHNGHADLLREAIDGATGE